MPDLTTKLRLLAVAAAFALPVGLLSLAGDGRDGPSEATKLELRPGPSRPPGPDGLNGLDDDAVDAVDADENGGVAGRGGAPGSRGRASADNPTDRAATDASAPGSDTAEGATTPPAAGGAGAAPPADTSGTPPSASRRGPRQPGWVELGAVESPRTRSGRFRIGSADTRLVFRSGGAIEIFLVDPAQGVEATAGFAEVTCDAACDEEHVVAAPAGEYELEVRSPDADFEVVIEEFKPTS